MNLISFLGCSYKLLSNFKLILFDLLLKALFWKLNSLFCHLFKKLHYKFHDLSFLNF